jgi:hypothetical protein
MIWLGAAVRVWRILHPCFLAVETTDQRRHDGNVAGVGLVGRAERPRSDIAIAGATAPPSAGVVPQVASFVPSRSRAPSMVTRYWSG